MRNTEPKRPEYEIIGVTERIARDPRGMARVTLFGDNLVIIQKGVLPELSVNQDQAAELKGEEE